jgi:hypothetical protein
MVRYQRPGLSNYGNQSRQEMFARGPNFPIRIAMETRLQLQHILSNANNWHVSSQFHNILVSIYNVIKYLVIALVECILVWIGLVRGCIYRWAHLYGRRAYISHHTGLYLPSYRSWFLDLDLPLSVRYCVFLSLISPFRSTLHFLMVTYTSLSHAYNILPWLLPIISHGTLKLRCC